MSFFRKRWRYLLLEGFLSEKFTPAERADLFLLQRTRILDGDFDLNEVERKKNQPSQSTGQPDRRTLRKGKTKRKQKQKSLGTAVPSFYLVFTYFLPSFYLFFT